MLSPESAPEEMPASEIDNPASDRLASAEVVETDVAKDEGQTGTNLVTSVSALSPEDETDTATECAPSEVAETGAVEDEGQTGTNLVTSASALSPVTNETGDEVTLMNIIENMLPELENPDLHSITQAENNDFMEAEADYGDEETE